MKKIVSLLLAGVMGLTMASAVAAKPAQTSIAQNDWNYIYGTLAGGSSPYYGYSNGTNLLWQYEDGEYVPLNNYYYWWYLQHLEDLKDAATDSDIFLPADTEIKNQFSADWVIDYGTAACPHKDKDNGVACTNTACKAYLIHDASGYSIVVGCPAHSYQKLDTTVTTPALPNKPGISLTHSVIGYSSIGGRVLINGINSSVSVAHGGSATVSVVAHDGYEVEYVTVNGVSIGADTAFTLDDIRGNYYISAYFRKIPVNIPFTVTAKSTGNGNVYAIVDGVSVGTIGSVTGYYKNSAELRFVPAKGNYKLSNVTINGVSMGPITNFAIDHFRDNLNVEAAFVWDNPYSDVKTHLAAVEYVTENSIMGSPNQYLNTDKFQGEIGVTVKALACYLAEMADVSGKLNTVKDRIAWAEAKGLIADKEDLTVSASLQRTCDMLEAFLRGLEKDNKIVYTALKNADSAYKVANAMNLVNESLYNKNGNISRYDMAEICYAISNLDAVVAK